MKPSFRINRLLKPGPYRMEEVFADIRACPVLREIFADEREIDRVVSEIAVSITDRPHVMFVDNHDATITIGMAYLREASDEFLYLDIIHELCHVKQHLQGLDLYDRSKSYVDRETEIDAYRITVREARRIGLDDEAICHYLQVPWISHEEHERLAARMGVENGLRTRRNAS